MALYCTHCWTVWNSDRFNHCARCNAITTPTLVVLHHCLRCDVMWRPEATLTCWMCDHPGMTAATGGRPWEENVQAAEVTHQHHPLLTAA